MSDKEDKSMSQEDLRKRLYQMFKNKGVLDSLKTQLRSHLIHELKHRSDGGEPAHMSKEHQAEYLLLRASNSLIADHLERCGYDYSLSVFYSECGLEKDKVFTAGDLLQLMKINPKSKLHWSLTSSSQNKNGKGFLFQMLTEMTDYHLHKESKDADSQTAVTSYKESLVEKLQFVDEQFEEMYPKGGKFESLEMRLSEYRREMEAQLRAEMARELQHFKDVEIAKIRMEEREKSQKEISDFRRELENAYQLKTECLASREKNAIERLQRQQEIDAKEFYSQRQVLLKDIELVRSRENDLRQRMEAFEMAQKLHEEKTRSVDDMLRKRELEVKNIEDTFEQKVKSEVFRHQIILKEEYLKRTQKVSEDERRNKEEAARLQQEAMTLHEKKQELEKAISKRQELEIEADTLKVQLSLLTRQNEYLTEKLKETVDYPLIQEEKMEFQTQAKLLKQQLDELRKENQLLRENALNPAADCASLKHELKILENARKLDLEEYKTQKERLEKRLQREVEQCAELKVQLLNSEDCVKRLNAEVELLELQLRRSWQAFEKDVYCYPKPSMIDHSLLDVSPYIHADKGVFKSQLVLDPTVERSGISCSYQHHSAPTCSTSSDSDIQFVAKTKTMINEMEKDDEYLKRALCNYREKLIQAADVDSILYSVPVTRGQLNTVSTTSSNRVNFLDSSIIPQQHIHVTRLKPQIYERVTEGDRSQASSNISSARRLSSTPISKPAQNVKRKKEKISTEDHNGSYISSSHHSPNERISPIPKINQFPSPEHDVAPLASEVDKELVSSVHQPVADPPRPAGNSEPRSYSDSSLQGQEDIPEQLECDTSHASEDLVSDNVGANVPPTATPQFDSLLSKHMSEESLKQNDSAAERIKETDAKKDFGEQKSEDHSLLNEIDTKENLTMVPKVSDAEREKAEENLRPDELGEGAKTSVNPMDKYMQMLLQSKAEEQSEKVVKESVEDISLEEKISNASITALSHGEADDDFW
ncbi:centriole and centriolar satellite protein OFD1 isoform X2 [Spea bombifrons]|uniref:centriole and centriolar satellite protein OFD1 isoform X2 n=1 Tax=Spea bombifrons TaxID=233779 RepID=UPI00234BA1F0|nr:centriole and centriolar satellite protein OFD1 isoform X2 [Spea bombifrons]